MHREDLIAGVSVAAVAVPIAIAYSQLAGVPPANGLYASILTCWGSPASTRGSAATACFRRWKPPSPHSQSTS